MKPTLLILAAGMGSRFGGLKQVEPVGPNGEAIIDYSIFDAIRAGFGKVVFVIRENFAEAFKEKFDKKLKGKIEVEYVYQELDMLPEGFSLPVGREKPWGTSHAILVAKDVIHEPFCALNADDFYGHNAYNVMAKFLISSENETEYSMVGYNLKDTLSEFGHVSRGVCNVDENQNLKKIVETIKILKRENDIISVEEDGSETLLTGKESVSMNIWGFKLSVFETLESKFKAFLKTEINKTKSEMYIPSVVFEMIDEKKATVKVLEANSPWFGVTYKEDKPFVVEKIKSLIVKGDYPEKLF
ncbi:MAG: nucleotidyltransferase [Prolixibacteraceae bacterium]|jgi:UTP-glucose-1-phosphate uridylyltransferase|nr:nucleotidyltransferase [Prolixibacteraceae bacterium]MBT6006527.1 nucleotidyltransferase [Prolixibacteraceae bacterium]MBT6763085.1 nucleotidyltransferase [Prolixibacteraceae bacterium]MBT6997913.1 nucleotidyltransferase [Prolixibacteraceae bacterium]MBT7395633.1 nucleotidyltransferase [Prolixibacteraceae bacterium]